MKQALMCILFIGYMLLAHAQGPRKTVFKTYRDAAKKISIKYPANWQSLAHAGAVFLIARPKEEQGQKFRENVNLVTGEAKDLYLVEYAMDAKIKMARDMNTFKEISEKYIKIDGLDCFHMIYEFNANGFRMHNAYYVIVKNDTAYSLTFSAITTTFNKHYPLFQEMANSFTVD